MARKFHTNMLHNLICLLKLNHHDLISKIHTVKSYKVTQAEDEIKRSKCTYLRSFARFARPIWYMRSRFSALSACCKQAWYWSHWHTWSGGRTYVRTMGYGAPLWGDLFCLYWVAQARVSGTKITWKLLFIFLDCVVFVYSWPSKCSKKDAESQKHLNPAQEYTTEPLDKKTALQAKIELAGKSNLLYLTRWEFLKRLFLAGKIFSNNGSGW